MARPHLTFFCELAEGALQELFSNPGLIEDLQALDATVSLGILDLSAGRAQVVRELNQAGIPVIAWQLLPTDQGYWFNLGNAPQAIARYAEFREWTAQHQLQWAGVGIDIEPDIRDYAQARQDASKLAGMVFQRAKNHERLWRARAEYAALVAQIRNDGYSVDSYQLPVIVDERKAGSTLLQRITGVIDLATDREVLMVYTSLLPMGEGVLWNYGPDAGSLAVGVTGGGVEIGSQRPLEWDELARDLRLASYWTNDVHIFSLEGCVWHGFMSRLRSLDWEAPITIPSGEAARVAALRKGLQAGLWASNHPTALVAGLAGTLWLWDRYRWRQRD